MGTFGDTLRQAREDLGASLADAERETRISRRYLEALESEDEAALPAPVYTRGFIRTYCRYLGLNPDGMLELFGPRRALDGPVAVRPIPAELHTTASMPVRPLILAAGLVLALLLSAYLWTQYTSFVENIGQLQTAPTSRGNPTATAPPSGRAAVPSPSPAAGPSPLVPPIAQPVASPSPSPAAAPARGLVVEVVAVERSWLEVWVDGRSVLAETIGAGVTRAFSAEQQVRMRVGNAGGIQVTVNGVQQGPLGARGQAVDASWGRQ
jgi:cytoskeleton protein RodZ